MKKYYQNEFRFNEVHSRNNLPVVPTHATHMKDRAYVINIDEYKSIETPLIEIDNVTHLMVLEMNTFQKRIKKS